MLNKELRLALIKIQLGLAIAVLLLSLWLVIDAWSMSHCWFNDTCALGKWLHGDFLLSSTISMLLSFVFLHYSARRFVEGK